MASQQESSGLLASLGNRLTEAFNEGKAKPIELNFGGQLPKGIEGGVAQLRDLKIGVYKDDVPKLGGKPYFMGQAIVIAPREVKGQKVAGLFTKIGPEPLCDTLDRGGDKSRKTFAQHFKFMLDHLRQLGWNCENLSGKSAKEVDNLIQNAMKALCKQAPFFSFRTWAGLKQVLAHDADGKLYLFEEDDDGRRKRIPGKGPYSSEQEAKVKNPYAGREPMINHVWGEVLPNYRLPAQQNVADDTAASEEGDYSPEASAERNGSPPGDVSSSVVVEAFDEFGLEELVLRASVEDGEAQDKLNSLAVEAGHSEEDVMSAENWQAVAEMIRNPAQQRSSIDSASEDDSDGDTPQVDQIVHYHPIDPKTKKPSKKAVECVVTAVDLQKRQCNLKSQRDSKINYTAVSWASLS